MSLAIISLYCTPLEWQASSGCPYLTVKYLIKVNCLDCSLWVCDDSVKVGPHPVIPDHTLRQGAGVLVTVLAVMLTMTYLSVHRVTSTKTWSLFQLEFTQKWYNILLPGATQLQLRCWFRLYAVSVLKKLLGFILPGSYCSVLVNNMIFNQKYEWSFHLKTCCIICRCAGIFSKGSESKLSRNQAIRNPQVPTD